MFGLGWPEVGLIALAAVLIFGPKKIPEIGSALGKTIRNFKAGVQESAEDQPSEEKEKDAE